MKNFLRLSICLIGLLNFTLMHGQCISDSTNNVYAFSIVIDNYETNYEIVKEGKTWTEAANCAKEQGGRLAEITSQAEQDAIFDKVNSANINASQTVAADGGPASYLWIGGNDLAEEGTWVWNGDNNSSSMPFFMGDYITGVPINDAYNNWGGEPDNSGDQDGLGLAITLWDWGVAGQWNDVQASNALYYIIEYPGSIISTAIEDVAEKTINVYPNPAQDQLYIDCKASMVKFGSIKMVNTLGDIVLQQKNYDLNQPVNINMLPQGVYFLYVEIEGERGFYQKIIVN